MISSTVPFLFVKFRLTCAVSKIIGESANVAIFYSLFYDAFSVTRLNIIDDRVTSE
jgi:hypothetical protein